MLPGAKYLGVDLAWGERARTGLAALDGAGRLVDSASVRTDDEIAVFVEQHASDTLVAAIDAPLVVPNDTGQRPCEALVGQLFSRYRAGAYPANRGNPSFFPEPRGARLASRLGWVMDPSVPPAPGRSVAIEVYPHPAMVSLFSLEFVIPYKGKRGRDVPALKVAYEVLFNHVEATCGELLALSSSRRWAALRSIASRATRKFELEAIEDEIDAIFCAYLAWLWANDRESMVVLGDFATGYIVTPTPPMPRGADAVATRRRSQSADTRAAKVHQLALEFRAALPALTAEESQLLASIAASSLATARGAH